jgi:hypothetical protein
MTRRCADSVTPSNLPPGFDLYGGYNDGLYNNVAAIQARFPGKTVVHFTVFARDNIGDCLDVEQGDATPQQAPGWVQNRRNAGHGGPLVYCSESLWPQVRQAFVDAGVPEPGYWIAGYPGSVGQALYPGSVAHQWIDRGPYDESIVVDYLPGIDPAPSPAPNPPVIYPGEDVQSTHITFGISGGQGWAPSPVAASKVVSVTVDELDPEAVGGYPNVPMFRGVATQTSVDAPNGALVFVFGANGTYGATVWSVA